MIIWQLYRSKSLFLKKKDDVLIFRGEDSRYLQLIFKWVNRKNEYFIYVCTCMYTVYIYVYEHIQIFLLLKERESKCDKNI